MSVVAKTVHQEITPLIRNKEYVGVSASDMSIEPQHAKMYQRCRN